MIPKIDETAIKLEVCPRCGSIDYQKRGKKKSKRHGYVQRATCKVCGRYYYMRLRYMNKKHYKARILNLVIHLSYFNLSTRGINKFLLRYLRANISKSTIALWIKEYGNPGYEQTYRRIMQEIEEDKEFLK